MVKTVPRLSEIGRVNTSHNASFYPSPHLHSVPQTAYIRDVMSKTTGEYHNEMCCNLKSSPDTQRPPEREVSRLSTSSPLVR